MFSFQKKASRLNLLILIFLSIFLMFSFWNLKTSGNLNFSDGAKFADIARNINEGNGFVSSFSFFSNKLFEHARGDFFSARGVPLLMPYSIATVFKLFGVSDLSVVLTSGFYYLLLVVMTFFLGRELFGNLVGFLSGLAIASNINFLDYATSGASETLFTFLIIATAYLIFIKKKWANYLIPVSLVLIYFARPQGILFILALLIIWTSLYHSIKKVVVGSLSFMLFIYLFDKFVLYPLSWKTNVYPIFTRGIQAFFQYSSNFAVSDALRGGVVKTVNLLGLGKKLFYNLYNFYKLLPEIASPYMWGLFFIGLAGWGKNKSRNLFKLLTLFLVISNFTLVALTIPFFRYIHPVVPLMYIVATGTMVKIVRQVVKKNHAILASSLLILLFTVGQSLGVILLDSRFEVKAQNKGKAPVYVELSYLLKENTNSGDIVITNLDTWGSWYGERKTVWFPLTPEMLDINENESPPFDVIYLTDYRIDDENYYMGEDWREVFENPTSHSIKLVKENYEFAGEFFVDSEETYENQSARAVLLKKRGG